MQLLPSMSRWLVLGAAVAAGAGVGIGAAVVSHHGSKPVAATPARATAPDTTWPAGAKRAPDFRLRDQTGKPVSLRSFRGRVAIVTFIDPVCRSLCPLEARVLGEAVRTLRPHAPALVSVSVNPPEDTRANFATDARHWRLPREWRWGVGSHAQLARVWHAYDVAVLVQKKGLAGVSVRDVAHTEAAYVVDAQGYQRALFLYPFRAADVEREVRQLERG